jgi:acyl-CoA reductase-like NAD-dependent aldehyde dehydrogenase
LEGCSWNRRHGTSSARRWSDLVDEFATRLGERLDALTVGDGLRDGVDVGPLIDEQAGQKVLDLMRDALDRGAAVVAGGGAPIDRATLSSPQC